MVAFVVISGDKAVAVAVMAILVMAPPANGDQHPAIWKQWMEAAPADIPGRLPARFR